MFDNDLTLCTKTTEAGYIVRVSVDDSCHERPREAGRLILANTRRLQVESDTASAVIRRDSILVPVFLYQHTVMAIRAVAAQEFNEGGAARTNGIQMIQEALGCRPQGMVDDPDAVLDTARSHNPFHCRFDSGLAGFFVFSRGDLRKYKTLEALLDVANTELESIATTYNGDWTAFDVIGPDGKFVDGCSGFCSMQDALDAGLSAAQAYARETA